MNRTFDMSQGKQEKLKSMAKMTASATRCIVAARGAEGPNKRTERKTAMARSSIGVMVALSCATAITGCAYTRPDGSKIEVLTNTQTSTQGPVYSPWPSAPLPPESPAVRDPQPLPPVDKRDHRDHRLNIVDLRMNPAAVLNGQGIRSFQVTYFSAVARTANVVIRDNGKDVAGQARAVQLLKGRHVLDVSARQGYRFAANEHCFTVVLDAVDSSTSDRRESECAVRKGFVWTLQTKRTN